MKTSDAAGALAALAHEHRLTAFRLLVAAGPEGMAAGVLADALGVAPSSLSFHLKELEAAGLVTSRRQGRNILYTPGFPAMRALLGYLTHDCCGGRPELCGDLIRPPARGARPMPDPTSAPTPDRRFNILYLCTGNSARSVLAEVLTNARHGDRFRAFSAGSHPKGAVHPMTLQVLEEAGHPTAGLASKSWDVFAGPEAPDMDFIVTVCDAAAGEACPLWPGRPTTAHWGFPDPAAATGRAAEVAQVFRDVMAHIAFRIDLFARQDIAALDAKSLKAEMDRIGTVGAPS